MLPNTKQEDVVTVDLYLANDDSRATTIISDDLGAVHLTEVAPAILVVR